MTGMIMHHGQAIEMAHMVTDRSTRTDLKALAERIDVAQVGEIGLMQRWLTGRGVAMEHQHTGAHELMPGMLTAEDLTRLRNSSGAAFDRMFLEFMIRHHEGALTMVQQLVSQNGVQDPVLFQLINSIDADQRAEIARMRALLRTEN